MGAGNVETEEGRERSRPGRVARGLGRVAVFAVYLAGVLAVMAAVVSLVDIPPGAEPARYARSTGGPSWLGYQAVHAGPGVVVLVAGAAVAWRRRRARRASPFTGFDQPLG